MFSAAQLRALLRAFVNLDRYTFADDVAEDISAEGEHEADHRSAEEVLLSTLDNMADDKLTRFAIRLALSGHRDIPRKDELDFLTEAEAAFPAPQPQKVASSKKTNKPTLVKAAAKKTARKSIAA